MKSRILRPVAALAAFLLTIQVVVRLSPPRANQTSNTEENRSARLEATHAFEALRWYNNQRAYPTGHIPADWKEKALAHISRNNKVKSEFSPASVSWNAVGPDTIGGRVRSIAVNPLNPNTIYCGSVSGGIWKSTNGGASWAPTTDLASNLVIGTMVIDPADTSIIYAGTGEGYFNVDALRGAGVLKSTDAGATWNLLTNFSGTASPNFYYYINKLVIRGDDHNTLYAAMLGGIWKTSDAGASWSKLTTVTTSSGCLDLVANPSDYNTMYAAFGLFLTDGIYKTTNGGTSWSKLAGGFPATSTKYGRISLAIAPSNPLVLYACLADSNYYTHSIQKTTDGGTTWSAVTKPIDNSIGVNNSHLGGQGWYNNVIVVHPADANKVYTGGINLFRSTDGGMNWSRISDGYGTPFVHVDQHAIAFSPGNPSTMYFGNDGGMYRSTDGGTSFSAINKNLSITQLYSGAVHPTSEIYYGGSQDNGTLRTLAAPSWQMVIGGDGGATAVDYSTPTTVYTEYVYLSILKSVSSGNPSTWVKSMTGIPTTGSTLSDGTSDRCEFIAPLVMDPSNPLILVAGTYRVFRTTNGGGSWTAVSGDLTGDGAGAVGSSGSVITALAEAKSSSSTIYIGTSGSGTANARVCVTTNAGTWTDVTVAPLPNRYVKALAIDPANRDKTIVVYSGYGGGHVYRTTNRGTSWSDVSGDLPDIPVNTIVIDPASSSHWIIGTDLGVFETSNGGTNWIQQNGGLANVSVADLDLRGDQYLFAATHGRGMYKTTAPINVVPTSHLSISVHQNPLISRYVDLYVASDTGLSTFPSMQVITSGGSSTSPTLVQTSPSLFKASYEFTATGTITINVTALDSGGNTLSGQRTFQTLFLKRGSAQTVSSDDGEVSIAVPADALTEDTYFTVIPVDGTGGTIVSRTYELGPSRDFTSPISISLRYNTDKVERGKEGLLSIVHSNGSGWTPVASWVDVRNRTISARVGSLGTFAVSYDEAAGSRILPSGYRLEQNYPNPFNPVTTIEYALPELAHTILRVYDVMGREVTTLVDESQNSGRYRVSWDGRDQSGISVSSGVYFYRLSTTQGVSVSSLPAKKLLLAR